MKLKEALQRAVKSVAADKTRHVLRHILLQPAQDGRPACIVAGDGEVFTHLTLDEDAEVIDGAVAAGDVGPLLTDAKEVVRIEWGQGGGSARLVLRTRAETVGDAEFKVLPSSQYPAPTLPGGLDFVPEHAAHEMAQVLHAVGGDDPLERHLGYVQASADGLAASDASRIAVVHLPGPWRGLLSPRLFERWPKKAAIGVCVVRNAVYVRVGDDEVRHTAYASGPTRDLWQRAQALQPYTGPRLVVDAKRLAAAVKQAAAMGQEKAVSLKFRAGRVHVESAAADDSTAYQAQLFGDGGQRDTDLLINGQMLHQALKAVRTPQVVLGYRRPFDPLRVESGRFTECIWHMS